MPKEGLSNDEWNCRLERYANRNFVFGRGQRPPKGSRWAKILEKIDQCPLHKSLGSVNLFGSKIVCNCGFHKEKVF